MHKTGMMERAELRLSERQKLITLLYLAGRMPAQSLMMHLRTCEEMSLLRLPVKPTP